jgi:hypothetical protein
MAWIAFLAIVPSSALKLPGWSLWFGNKAHRPWSRLWEVTQQQVTVWFRSRSAPAKTGCHQRTGDQLQQQPISKSSNHNCETCHRDEAVDLIGPGASTFAQRAYPYPLQLKPGD